MRTRIYNYMKSVRKPVNHHQIARALGEREIDVVRGLNGMSYVVGILAIPLEYEEGGVYYYLKLK